MTDNTHIGNMPFIKLPGRVMLPHATRLLRLRADLTREIAPALQSDRLLAVGIEHHTDRRTGETDECEAILQYGDAPEYVPICICKMVAVTRLPNGGTRLLIRGISRGTRFSTRNQHEPRIEICPESYVEPPMIDREHRCEELLQLLEGCIPGASRFPLIHKVLEQSELGPLCDLIADVMGIGGERGLNLLSVANVDVRSDLLLDVLRELRRREQFVNCLTLTPSAN